MVGSLEGITEYRMNNGLRLLFCPDSSVATVTVNMVYRVGSRDEGPGEAGMAHLLEHLLGKSTVNISSLDEELTARGADYNGSTWYDRIQFHETLESRGGENLAFAFHLEAERMQKAILREDDLALEMDIVTNEFQYIENDPETVLWYRMMAVAFDWHSYGRPTIGNLSDIRNYPLENLRRFYRQHFRPDNATLIVAGRFDSAQAATLAAKHFAAIPRPEEPITRPWTVEPAQEGPRRVVLRREAATSRGGLLYHAPSGEHQDCAALSVLLDILTDQSTGLLTDEFVATGKVAKVTGHPASMLLADPGVFDIRVELQTPQDPAGAFEAMATFCESLEGRVSGAKVEAAKARLLKRHRRKLADVSALAVELSEWVAQDDWRGILVHRDRIASVNAEQVRAVAHRYLRASNRTMGWIAVTTHPDLVRITAPKSDSLMSAYRGEHPIEPGAYFDTSLANLRRKIHKSRIKPGLSLMLLPKRTRAGTVTARLRFRYGTPEGLRGLSEATHLLPSLLMQSTRGHDRRELQQALDLLQSDIAMTGYPGVLDVRIDSDREHLYEVIALLGGILRRPSLDGEALARLRNERLAKLREQLGDPAERCFNAVRRGLYSFPPTSPYYKPTLKENIDNLKALTVDDLRRLHHEVLGASYAEAAFVGDFDIGKLLVALGRAVADWASPEACEPIDPPYRPVQEQHVRIRTPDRAMAVVGVATLFALQDEDPDYPALLLANQVLGGGPTSRIQSRLRYTEGLSYHAATAMQVEARIACANLFGYSFSSPANVDTCLTGLRDEIERWIHDGVTQKELVAARQTWRREFELRLGDDAELAAELVSLQENDRSLNFYEDLLAAMEVLNADDVGRVLAARFGERQFLTVEAGDLDLPVSAGDE